MLKFPPPPSEPPPPHTPSSTPRGFRLPSTNGNEHAKAGTISTKCNKEMQTVKEWNNKHEAENNKRENTHRAVPPKKPQSQKPVLPSLPKAKVLYDYSPQDLDELELKEGDIIEILKERKFH